MDTRGVQSSRRWLILGVLVVSLLVAVLDNTVLNVAMRTIADPVRGLGASQAQLEWAINSYTLVFAGMLFTAGVLGDRIGRKRMLLIGLVVFGLASLASAYCRGPDGLVWARAFMGLGAAAIMPSTLSIISNVFDPSERGRAIGIWAGSVGLGFAIGPVVGGALLEHFWWGSVFLINVPILAAGIVAVARIVPESHDPDPGRVDWVGVLLSIVGLISLVYGIIYGGEHGFGTPRSWGPIVFGLAVLVVFLLAEARIGHPSLDVTLFRDARFSAAVACVGLVMFAALGTLFFLAFYLQLARERSPLEAGLLMTPFALAQLVFAPRSAAMVARYGPKAVCATGLALVAASLGGFAFVSGSTPMWILEVMVFVQGAGMANVMPPATEAIMSAVPRAKAGVGSAIQNTVRQVGGALGVAVLGAALSAVYRQQMAGPVAALPGAFRDAAGESLAGAHGVAAQLGGGDALVDAANLAFINAMHWAAAGSAIAATIGVAVALLWLPSRAEPEPDPPRRHPAPAFPPIMSWRS